MTSPDQTAIENRVATGLWIVEKPAGIWLPEDRAVNDGGLYFYNGQQWITYTHDNSGLISDSIV